LSDKRLNEIIAILKRRDTDVSPYLPEVMALCKDNLNRPEFLVLECELKGFNNRVGIEYYTVQPESPFDSGFIGFRGMIGREWKGKLQIRKPDGKYADVSHDFSNRQEFFVSAALPEIERMAKLTDDTVEIELPDLTELIGKEEGGTIVLLSDRKQLQDYVKMQHDTVIDLIEIATVPEKRAKADAAWNKYRADHGLPPEE
jgi:hypothetical protein